MKLKTIQRRFIKDFNTTDWLENLITPVVREVTRQVKGVYWTEDLHPMGLCARVSVYAYDAPTKNARTDTILARLALMPGDFKRAEVWYNTGKKIGADLYAPGTIGYLNGMNEEQKLVESIEELVEFVEKQIKSKI